MKLLVVSHACVTPINQSFFAQVARDQNWNVSLAAPESWNTEYSSNVPLKRWKDFEGSIFPIPVWKPGNIPLHAYRSTMVGMLRKVRPDAIYVHHEPYGLATLQVYLANALVDRCAIGFYAAQNIYKQYPVPFRWFEKAVLRESSFAFPVTAGALEVLNQKGYSATAEVLPLPVDLEVYYFDKDGAAKWRQQLSIADDVFVIGYLGRLVSEKGLVSLLRALTHLPSAGWRCVLAGSGPMEAELRALTIELELKDRVVFLGFLPHPEAPQLLSFFDVLVLPSETRPNWKEQFGRVILEANACRTAVVASNSGEIPKVLHATGGGVLVPERNMDALGATLNTLFSDRELVAQYAERGLRSVQEQFSQTALALTFADVIGQGVRQKAKG